MNTYEDTRTGNNICNNNITNFIIAVGIYTTADKNTRNADII